jgi:colicin import membrane protein
MSAVINNTEIDTVTKVAKVKTPTLSGKYIKFLVFGHWFVDRLAVTKAIDEATTEAVREQLELFAGVAKQTEMFDLFFAELKDSTKSMKALIKRHNTPPKEKKTRAKVSTDGVESEKKRGRKKKVTEVVHDKQDDLVAEIVAATQGTYGSPNPSLPLEAEEDKVAKPVEEPAQKKKYVRKSEKKVAEPVIEQIAEPVVVAPVEPLVAEPVKKKVVKKTDAEKLAEKEKKDAEKLAEKTAKDAEKLAEKTAKDAEKLAKKTADKPAKDAKKTADKPAKSKKDKNADKNSDKTADNISAETGGVRGDSDAVATTAKPVESPADEDELDVKPITCSITNIQYLLDNDNNVYHFSLHTLIGKFSNHNNSVILF